MGVTRRRQRRTTASLATAYADATGSGDEFVIPEDLSALSSEELEQLHATAVGHFDDLYGDGQGLSPDDLSALSGLTDGIDALAGEIATRDAAAAERDQAAAELAARVRPETDLSSEGDPTDADEEEDPDADGEEDPDAPAEEDEGAAETVTASGAQRAGATRIPLSTIRSRAQHTAARQSQERQTQENAPAASIRDVLVASGEGLGVANGTGLDWAGAGAALDRRLQGFNAKQYEAASKNGRHIREQGGLLTIHREIPEDLQIRSNDPDHVRAVFERASDESRLPGGSLVASGGWCAPSTVLYDFLGEVESRDGLLSIPEVGVPRGGISFTTGPDFVDIFSDIVGFSFTEEQDIAGEYAPNPTPGGPNVVGDKPCYKVECPPFEEYRLDVDGLCITAGLLQSRGFPEVLARTLRGALVAHDHRLNGKQIAQMAAGSTSVTLPATQAGTAAPVLSAIELQVEHYRYIRRMSRSTTLEAVFPFWIRGAVRADLARRQGVENFLAVTDAQINGWFASRGVNPQFVYNWQPITGPAESFTSWPTTVSFLLYQAGTWIRGAADIITVDTLYDSVLLGQNDFTALFTEEGWFVAKRGQDSRMVTTSLTADGVVAAAQDIAHNGTLAPAV